jgi:hypothetical protein
MPEERYRELAAIDADVIGDDLILMRPVSCRVAIRDPAEPMLLHVEGIKAARWVAA